MNSRALGTLLLGWYLLVPPPMINDHAKTPDAWAPLHMWLHVGSYDTAAECRTALPQARPAALRAVSTQPYFVNHHDQVMETMDLALTEARCIASDDPRLSSGQ
jgi:hypothetical protein